MRYGVKSTSLSPCFTPSQQVTWGSQVTSQAFFASFVASRGCFKNGNAGVWQAFLVVAGAQ